LGDCFILGSFSKITEVALIFGFLHICTDKKYVLILTRIKFGYILGAFFKNSSGHPSTQYFKLLTLWGSPSCSSNSSSLRRVSVGSQCRDNGFSGMQNLKQNKSRDSSVRLLVLRSHLVHYTGKDLDSTAVTVTAPAIYSLQAFLILVTWPPRDSIRRKQCFLTFPAT
jgi:hypothetical protein